METNEATTSSGFYQGERGAGGKFRKPHVRKTPSTPYDRPATQTRTLPLTQTQNQQSREGGWWFSKLVDPATRLISGGATRLFPTFFSKPSSDAEHPEVKQDASDEEPEHISDIQLQRSAEGGQGPREADRSKCCSDIYEHAGNNLGNSSDGSGLSEIEQMMKEKTFSRDDLNRLTEILHSRIADQPDADEQGKKFPNVAMGVEATGGSLGQDNLNVVVEEKQAMHLDRVTGAISNTFLQTTTRNQVGASPVEIAKAYMGARTSDVGLGSQSVALRDERNPLPTDGFSSKPYISLPSPKSSICWPGAMVQDQNAYLTPQTQRGRVGLHNLPRTPYSRAIHSRSASKLQGGGDRSLDILTHSKMLQTPIYGDSQVMRSSTSYDDGFGSVGPIRRIPRKIGDKIPKGADSSHPVRSGPFWAASSSTGPLPMVKQNLKPGSSSSDIKFQPVNSRAPSSSVSISTVHPQSSEMARKILEHLDRTIPTPQKKSAELRMATSWRKTPSSDITTVMPNGQFSESHVEGSDSHRNSHLIGQKFSTRGKEITGSSLPKVQPEQRETDEAADALNTNTLACKTIFSMAGSGRDGVGFNPRPSIDFKNTHNFLVNTHEVPVGLDETSQSEKNQLLPLHNRNDGQDASRFAHGDSGSEAINVQKKPPTQIFGNKPPLTHISIAKPYSKHRVPLDNGSGFTFPVSASSGVLCEPPTPSIVPSFSASGLPRPQEKTTVPSYSFGSNTAGRTLVFSFLSTSSATPGDASTLKFNFSSDKKARISFSNAVDATVAGQEWLLQK